MPNPAVVTSFATPDPSENPLNLTSLIDLLNLLVTSAIQGDYAPYVLSSTAPGVLDQDKVWIQTDTSGRPIATKTFYNGGWRRVYNGMPKEIRGYTGNPSVDFDTTGRGKISGDYDGWAICNGNNGTPNLTDRFLVSAHVDNSNGHTGYGATGWSTFVDETSLQGTGGERNVFLDATNTYQPGHQGITVDRWQADGNSRSSTGQLYGIGSQNPITLLPEDPGETTPHSFSIIPPFYALAFITFVGYV